MYVPTIEDMLANAYNNWRREHVGDKLTVCPQATLEKHTKFYRDFEQNHGYKTISLDCVTSAELKTAMEWYKGHTDWSAFKKKDWEKAYASLN